MSKARVFGQQVKIEFEFGDGQPVRVAEIDNFSVKHNDVVKKNSSLGENGVGSIDVLDDGGSGTFEAKKSDSLMSAYFIVQSNQNRANGAIGERGKTAYVKITDKTTFVDGSVEMITYEGVVLHSPEKSVASRTDEVIEKFEMEYKTRSMSTTGGEAGDSAELGASYHDTAVGNLATLCANVTASLAEGSALLYSHTTALTNG